MHDFDDSLRQSHDAEDSPIWEDIYRLAFPGFQSCHSHPLDGAHQRAGCDRTVLLKNSGRILIDEKVRFKDYGDILLEFLSDVERKIPGWVCKPLLCDYIAYAIFPSGKCYLLPVPALQAAWLKHSETWKAKYKICDARNQGWVTRNVAVPVKTLYSAMANAMCFNFPPSTT